MKYWNYILLIFASSNFCILKAQSVIAYRFEHITQKEGLEQGSGYAVSQFDDFIWFATQDGLSRYDGYSLKTFKTTTRNGINSSFVQALLADSKGRFWVGTRKGINFYDKRIEGFKSFRQELTIAHSLDSVSIEKFIEDYHGNVWIMTDEQGVFRYSYATKKLAHYLPLQTNLYDFCLDRSGNLWLSTYDDVFYFDYDHNAFVPTNIKTKLRINSKSVVQAICFDVDNKLWMSIYNQGVYQMDTPKKFKNWKHFTKGTEPFYISDNEIRCIMKDRAGNLWLGTKQGGVSLYRYDLKQFVHIRKELANEASLGEDFVLSLFQDRQGIVWLGLGSSGFSKYDPLRFPFRTIKKQTNLFNTMLDDMVFTIWGDDSGLYFGTNKGGLSYLNSLGQFQNFVNDPRDPNSLQHNEIYSISTQGDNYLWLATSSGLNRFDKKTRHFKSFLPNKPYYLYAVVATSFGEIWTGGERGLECFNTKTGQWKKKGQFGSLEAYKSHTIRTFFVDSKHRIWIGTLGHGVICYDPTTKTTRQFDNKQGLTCSNVRSFYEDTQSLFIGTDCGLYEMDLKSFKISNHYSSVVGKPLFRLPNDVIYGIRKDKRGDFWLSCNKGLIHFSQTKGVIRNYDSRDGLQSNEFNTNCSFVDPAGNLYFGGVKGVNYFNPDSLRKNTFVPPLKMTKMKVMDSLYYPSQKKLELQYDQNFFEFEFVALNFSNTLKNQYLYKMEGVDGHWIPTQEKRTINYTKLPPGEYQFMVRGSNGDGVWNPEPLSLKINIIPPFWGHWWFWPLVWLLAFSALGMAYYFYLKNEFKNKLKIQTIRNEIASDLHDDVGSTLGNISFLGEMAKMKFQKNPLEALPILEKIIEDSQEMIQTMRGMVWTINPANDNAQDFVEKIRAFAEAMLSNRNIRLHFKNELEEVQRLSIEQQRHLFLIFKEITHNIAKHSQASNVQVFIEKYEAFLWIKVTDDGVGFDLNEVSDGNGLRNLQQRASQLMGRIEIKSEKAQGTTLKLMIPL